MWGCWAHPTGKTVVTTVLSNGLFVVTWEETKSTGFIFPGDSGQMEQCSGYPWCFETMAWAPVVQWG